MRKIIVALLMVPVALCLAYGAVNLVGGITSGEINLLTWIAEHKVALAFAACYVFLTFIGPFKRKG